MAHLDTAFSAATSLTQVVTANLPNIISEEDAKVQIINRFLVEVLGWQYSDLSTERKHPNGFSDYIVSNNGQPAFLIEAKRIGKLEIATAATSRQYYKLSGPALKHCVAGIEQAAAYCAAEGIQLAILTDGLSWIFFRPFLPDVSYKSKEAIVFPTLQSVLDGFAEFHQLAALESIQERKYRILFDRLHNNRILLETKLTSAYDAADIHPEGKSQIAFDMDKVFTSFFSGLTGESDPELLIEYFVETKESRIADFSLEKLTMNVLGNIDPNFNSVDTSLRELIAETISNDEGDTVFIVGPSGAGKTTFLDRFFRKTLPKLTREKCVVVNINCLDATGVTGEDLNWIAAAVISALERQLFDDGYPKWTDLMGLYHLEYKKRSEGADAELYRQDKDAFRKKFGEYVEAQVEKDREGYLRKLLSNVIISRKKLPIFVVDNTDEFSLAFKQSVFQYFQALRRHAGFCLLMFPATDRSAWEFSKTEIFNIYSSRSFFLPTPSPREVFRKRVDYLKQNITQKQAGKQTAVYGLGKSIKLSIDNLQAFASAIEDIFVDQDYVSNRIGTLANYNIRKTLSLARRVITSSAIGPEDLLKSYFVGNKYQLDAQRFMRALLLGDFNFFNKSDSHYIFPIFDVDVEVRQSPLIHLRVLSLLRGVHDKRTADVERYMPITSVTQFFDTLGCTELSVERSLGALMVAGLVEAYDPTAGSLALAQKVAITYSGLTHLELAVFNRTFFEQQALTASLANPDVAQKIRSALKGTGVLEARLAKVRELFASYLIEEDASFVRVPPGAQFLLQASLVSDLRKYADGTPDAALTKRDVIGVSSQVGLLAAQAKATVDWFDEEKGYGFAKLEDRNESVFFHASVIEQGGFEDVRDGDELVCDVERTQKGISISRVYSTTPRSRTKREPDPCIATVVRLFETRGYGFVRIPTQGVDAFFHVSVFPNLLRSDLRVGSVYSVEINEDRKGRGYQVRKVIAQVTASSQPH